MGAWRVEQHYGFGAACLPISVEPLSRPRRPLSLREGVAAVRDELHARGGSLRRSLGVLPGLLLGLTVCVTFLATVLRERVDASGLEVVMLTSPLPEPAAPAEPEPPAEVELARTPEPPPPARPLAPEPPAPAPVEVARVEPPRPPAPSAVGPKPSPSPPPAARPRVRIDTLARAPSVPPQPPPARRAAPVATQPVAAPARPYVMPVASRPEPPPASPAPSRDPVRFAAVRPGPSEPRPRVDVTPALAGLDAAAPAVAPGGTRLPPPETAARPRVAEAVLPLPAPVPAAPGPAPTSASAASVRLARAAPAPAVHSPAPAVAVAGLAAPSPGAVPDGPAFGPARHGVRASGGDTAGSAHAPGEATLQGVPLGSLASCVSDREEDRLKQRLVAAVTTQKHCTSSSGTYRFVETKNLNSFLLWIDRAPGRRPADRCVELAHALDCLARQAGRESN